MYRVASVLAIAASVAHAEEDVDSYDSYGSAPASSSSSSPLFTGSQAFAFVKDSVMVTKDLTYFAGSTAGAMVWEHVPADAKKQVLGQYNEISAKIDTLRIQNGIPTPAAFYSDMEAEYYKKVDPLVQKGLTTVTKLSAKPFEFVKKGVASFEKAYPEHTGKLTTESVFDFSLVAFFLFYFVFSYFYKTFCFFCCCGCCAKRAAPAKKPELVKPTKSSAAKTNGVAKRK